MAVARARMCVSGTVCSPTVFAVMAGYRNRRTLRKVSVFGSK